MATKKRATLRSKSARSSTKTQIKNKIDEIKAENQDYHENPMLKLSKVSKKDKQMEKSRSFNESLIHKTTFNTSSSISKSALRRKRRKEKEQLKPKLSDLLDNLPEPNHPSHSQHESKNVPVYLAPTKTNANRPNASKLSGHKALLKTEGARFNNVLKNPEFRTSPFAALKNAIQSNLQS